MINDQIKPCDLAAYSQSAIMNGLFVNKALCSIKSLHQLSMTE